LEQKKIEAKLKVEKANHAAEKKKRAWIKMKDVEKEIGKLDAKMAEIDTKRDQNQKNIFKKE
jgi:hypothetical protein